MDGPDAADARRHESHQSPGDSAAPAIGKNRRLAGLSICLTVDNLPKQ
jgi:hypothetical protein